MPRTHTHPTDALVDDLVGIYDRAAMRLEAIVGMGLRRGLDPARLGTVDQRRGDSTLAYRQRQLDQANAILGQLRQQVGVAAPVVVHRAYRGGLVAVDRTIGIESRIAGEFGRVHTRAVQTLAANLTASLTAAADSVGENLATVFARADALEGALTPAGVAGLPFIGRRQDDPYRSAALRGLAESTIGLDTRRQASRALADRLVREGVTDALTGFVDRAGKRWPLQHYARMVARTTTREAMTRGTVNRLREGAIDLVTITSHPHTPDICSPYDGRTFSMDGEHPGYPELDRLPPFHPNCVHVLTPAAANLDEFERELEAGATEPPAPVPAPPPPTPAPGSLEAAVDEFHASEAARRAEALIAQGGLRDDAVSIRESVNPTPMARSFAGEALDLVDRVHTIPPGLRGRMDRPVPIRHKNLPGGTAGEYVHTTLGEAIEINIDPSGPLGRSRDDHDLTNTLLHELGHYVDHQAIGRRGTFYTAPRVHADNPELLELQTALYSSRAVAAIRAVKDRGTMPRRLGDGSIAERPLSTSDHELLDYLLNDQELFARAYAQWIVLRGATGDRAQLLNLALRTESLAGHATQWEDDDFRPIAEAFDRVFRAEGLIP